MSTSLYLLYIYLNAAVSKGKQKTKAQAIFLNPFTVCSVCKRKLVACLFVYEEAIGSYPFANGLNGLNELDRLNRLAHLWEYRI
jgi:hypothetical protein